MSAESEASIAVTRALLQKLVQLDVLRLSDLPSLAQDAVTWVPVTSPDHGDAVKVIRERVFKGL